MPTIPIAPRADAEGSIGKTTRRWSSGHFMDIYAYSNFTNGTITVTAANALGVLDNMSGITSDEADQLKNIDTTIISVAQWAYLGAMDQGLATTDSPTFVTVNANITGNLTGTVLTASQPNIDITTLAGYSNDHGALVGLLDDDHTQYHTDGRALTWLGTRSTTDLAEGTNLYWTDGRFDTRFDTRLALKSTTDLAEGTNLYYTASRVNTEIWETSNFTNTATVNFSVVAGVSVSADVVVGAIDHDLLLNFVANEHINHTSVSLLAGTGISASGLGDLTASRTINVDPAGVDHDALLNFVANEHIDHTTVSITGGLGLTSGGDITASRTIDLDINSLTEDLTPDTAADYVATYDDDGVTHKKVKLENLTAASAGSLTETITVGENVVSGDLLYLKNDGKYWKADYNAEATASTELRLATDTILADAVGPALIYGSYTTTGLTAGALYYIGLTGGITTTQPTGDGDIVRIVGTAVSATVLIFNPDETYIEIDSTGVNPTQPAYREVTSTDTFSATDYTINCTSGTFTVNLPTAVGIQGRIYIIKNSGTGTITLDASTTETIDGSLTLTLSGDDAFTVQSTGTNWIII